MKANTAPATTEARIIREIPKKRLRVRRVDEDAAAVAALDASREKGRAVIKACHGGGVANCYGYPAETEGCITIAWPDGHVWQRVVRLPANKVTFAGVFRCAWGEPGLFDDRYTRANRRALAREVISYYAKNIGIA